MEETSLQPKPIIPTPLLTFKRKILIGIVMVSLVSGAADVVTGRIGAHQLDAVIFLASAIGYGILILSWCKADSQERGDELSSGWTPMLVVFGWLALIAYLFKSRGFAKGLLAVLYTFGFAIGTLVFDLIVLIIGLLAAVLIFGKGILK